MDTSGHTPSFWLGNILLGLALVLMLFMSDLWAHIGSWAMGLWMVIAAAGMYLITKDKGPSSNMPD